MGIWNPGPAGTNGDDTFTGDASGETIQGLNGEDNLQGNDGDDTFVISAPSNISSGDFYYGGNGNDVMRLTAGGTYNFSGAAILAIETLRLEANLTANFFQDDFSMSPTGWTVDGNGRTATFNFTSVGGFGVQITGWTFTNGNFTVNINLTGNDGEEGWGSNVNDTITGGAGPDQLHGQGGADTLIGGAGNDIYFTDGLDTIIETANNGTDYIETTVSFSLEGYDNIENLTGDGGVALTLTGNSLDNSIVGESFTNDTLIGGVGNDTLNGLSGTDILIGGVGDDTYVFGNVGPVDTITENPGEGTDTIFVQMTSLTSFSMAGYANVENLTYSPSSSTGRTITGSSINNVIAATSSSSPDMIDGGAGDDTMSGSGGNDTYFVDSLGDVVIENVSSGTDTIRTALAAYALSTAANAQVENLTYTGASDFSGRGNDLNNTITGGNGNDTLEGGLGDDTLAGGSGIDTASYANAANDVWVNLSTAGAQNTFVGSDTLNSIENLTGSAFNDQLVGNGSANVLSGGDGVDTLRGGGGNDTLDGGRGIDAVVYVATRASASWHRNPDGSWTVNAGDGADQLVNVERVLFNDGELHLDIATRTFSGDGTSDILFQRDDGIVATWNVAGSSISSAAFLPAAGAEWHALGTADIGGDGRDDVIWRRDDGLIYAWTMNGGFAGAVALAGLDGNWSYLGAGDFNGDGTDDLAWRRNDGVVYLWDMHNSAISAANLVAGLDAAWELLGIGDFSSDGRDDFVWRNTITDETVLWQMNGQAIESSTQLSNALPGDWDVVGVGDTNGDGYDDLIVRRTSDGMVSVWAMQGETVLSATDITAPDPNVWSVHGVGDYDGDGRADILWQNNDGVVFVWLLDGATIAGAHGLSGIGPEWGII
ncbi:FG-GAP-like repeat-containing protein [Terricaulis sp.]|uniref:FG-GAP-like repeat-containing protein n=1 Tax=Terricaulis sp. TaxID=2768686 RepID=UPI0037843B88